jgi:hypothetical protein
MKAGWAHAAQKLLERAGGADRHLYDEAMVLSGYVDLPVLLEVGLCGESLGDAQGEAVSPLLDPGSQRAPL